MLLKIKDRIHWYDLQPFHQTLYQFLFQVLTTDLGHSKISMRNLMPNMQNVNWPCGLDWVVFLFMLYFSSFPVIYFLWRWGWLFKHEIPPGLVLLHITTWFSHLFMTLLLILTFLLILIVLLEVFTTLITFPLILVIYQWFSQISLYVFLNFCNSCN